jgi:paxillin
MLAELEHNLQHYNSRRSIPINHASSRSINNAGGGSGWSKDPSQMGSMIGGLSPDANKHGIHTIPKGDCAACGKPIIGQIIMALGRMWHPEHYRCCQCGEELGRQNFIERGGKAYCEKDYHESFSPRCAYCNGPIKDRCVTAMGKNFHSEHFVCVECGKPFGPEGYHEKDGQPYCKTDYFRLFAPKCRGCNKPVQARFLTALNSPWHPECFVCQDCSRPFNGNQFFELAGVPYCEQHYHERRGSVCGACRQPINGKCVGALGQRFHPEHFCCVECNRQLTARTFKDHNNQAMCQKCYEKINPSFRIVEP